MTAPDSVALVAEVFGQHAQCLDEMFTIGNIKNVAIEIGEHPLVWIEAVAVCQLDSSMDVAKLRAEGRGAGHRSIYVEPHFVTTTNTAIPGTGSIALEDVVPTVAQTMIGMSPALLSFSI